MVWAFTLKGEAIFENAFTLYVTLYVALYVKFAFNYFIQRTPAGKRDEGTDWMFGWGRAQGNPS
ncbi:hypothetical protein, partial [Clostridium sp. MCC353]|uniref:hypothetical protein n=1 Tax=Clostridium sp. MCC353 TaxID=2592646 RepID=UPI001C01EE6D